VRWLAVAHVIALSGFEAKAGAVFQLDVESAGEAEQDVSLAAPVVGEVSGRVFDHAHAEVAVLFGAPGGVSCIAGMLGRGDLGPVGDGHGSEGHVHGKSVNDGEGSSEKGEGS
jgi:hypothetical protein